MKQLVKAVLRRVGYEARPVRGPRRIATMETALAWLRDEGFRVATVLDVGASDGRWSQECLRHFPDATYVLYEPQAAHLPRLATFIEQHAGRVRHVDAAVGKEIGTALFDAADPFGGGLADGPEARSATTIEVAVTTLDDSERAGGLSGPYLVKLDTHGFEHGILEGAQSVLAATEILIIEAYNHRLTSEGLYFWELCAYLHDRGFRPIDLVDVMHRERDGSLWQMDLVFVRSTWPGFAANTYS